MNLTPPPKAAADEEAVRGWSGIHLDREGVADAHRIGKAIKGRGIGLFICSDLPRAVETTEILSKETGAPLVTKTPDLRTLGVGELEGSGLADSDKILRYYLAHPGESPKGGETVNAFKRRVIRKIGQIMDVSVSNRVIVGVVTHHWVVNLLKLWVEAGTPANLSFDISRLLDFEDEPGTIYDMRERGGRWAMPKVPPGTNFQPGPVIIRHEETKMN